MYTKETFEKFMADYGYKPVNCKREVKDVPGLLHDDEVIYALAEGFLKTPHNPDPSGCSLVIATNKRILGYYKSFMGSVKSEEVPLSKISSASYGKGLVFGYVVLTSASNKLILDNCVQVQAEKFAKIVNQLLAEVNEPVKAAPAAPQEDNLAKLEKLFELKEKGILSEAEFAEQKAKLLS